MNNNLIYNIKDLPKTFKEWFGYTLQMILSVFVATVLIARVCNTPISSCLFGAFIGTIIYQVITGFKSPMFISSCGATCSAVIGALATGDSPNYLMVFIGGCIILLVYAIFAIVVKLKGIDVINKVFPPTIVGSITIIIGLNLAKFISSAYCLQVANITGVASLQSFLQVGIAIIVIFVTALVSQYGKGFIKNIPFLIGLFVGCILSIICDLCKVEGMISYEAFTNLKVIAVPDFAWNHFSDNPWSWNALGQTILYFLPVAICALLEHYSDHKTLSNIIGTDLTIEPGLDKTLLGDGVASLVGTLTCGLPNTSYGESIATIGFSKVASVFISTAAAIVMLILSFIPTVTAVVDTIPSYVFGGVSAILYGFIALSGLRTILSNKVDLQNNKNVIIISVILTIGVSEVFFGVQAFKGVALAMTIGVLLNLILRDKVE